MPHNPHSIPIYDQEQLDEIIRRVTEVAALSRDGFARGNSTSLRGWLANEWGFYHPRHYLMPAAASYGWYDKNNVWDKGAIDLWLDVKWTPNDPLSALELLAKEGYVD